VVEVAHELLVCTILYFNFLMQELCGLNVFNCLKNSCTLPRLQFFHQRKKKRIFLIITR